MQRPGVISRPAAIIGGPEKHPGKEPKKPRHVLRPQTAANRPLKYFIDTLYQGYIKRALKAKIRSHTGTLYPGTNTGGPHEAKRISGTTKPAPGPY